MINKICVNSVNTGKSQYKNQPQFKGGPADVVLGAIQYCEQNPMMNVAVLDLSTAIVPRTIVEGQTNPYAGFEAFRRESSGLIINCMIPGVIVMGIAKAIQSPIMGGKTKMGNSWANEDTINLITKHWKDAPEIALDKSGKALFEGKDAAQKSRVYNTIKKILEETKGVDGTETKSFAVHDFEESIKTLTDKVFVTSYKKADRDAIAKAYKSIAEKTHITENIKIGDEKYFSQNLESVVKGTPRVLREIVGGKIQDADLGKFATRAKRLLNAKSILGLGVIIPLAIAAQPINRWLTERSSGKKGAPIYKDFGDTQNIELSKEEKSALLKQKFISVGSMVGVAMLSMMKLPNMGMLRNLAQFKGIFPSMDQARLISTATFSSRMAASQDKNDLREATFRDIATFSSFYFLGDYVAKGIATGIQKAKGIELINILKEPPSKDANVFKKFWHWAKHTALKSSDEVYGAAKGLTGDAAKAATKQAQKMRSVCQLGNIAFSLIALGIVIPKMYRGKTNEEREKELKKIGVDQSKIDKYYHHFVKNNPNFASKNNVYEAFFTSK